MKHRTFLHDSIELITLGSHALEQDNFTQSFVENKIFNNYNQFYIILSIIIRYFVLMPFRLIVFIVFFCILSIFFSIACYINHKYIIDKLFFLYMKLFSFVLGIKSCHIGRKYKIDKPHIYVSNHTSFLDFIVLSSYKFHHAVISENHGGIFGLLFKFIISKNGSICFNRTDRKDKSIVKEKIINHCKQGGSPMIVFPEGVCVNNKSTVLFQKGVFELNTYIVPVALKYKKVLMNPYWNRRKHGFFPHIIYLITRWRIDVEVHWLDPIKLNINETPTEFSHRVKKIISDKINLLNTPWNGYFKNQLIYTDIDIFRHAIKKIFSIVIKERMLNLQYPKNLSYLSYYNWIYHKTSNKLFFNACTSEEFYYECCKEFLRIKSLTQEQKTSFFPQCKLFNNSTKSGIVCTCNNPNS